MADGRKYWENLMQGLNLEFIFQLSSGRSTPPMVSIYVVKDGLPETE